MFIPDPRCPPGAPVSQMSERATRSSVIPPEPGDPDASSPPVPRRTRNSAEATERVFLAAARRAFSEKGYSQTTVQDIVTGTGLSRPAFYRYFRSTDDVFMRIVSAVVDEFVLASRVHTGSTLRERVHAGNRRYLEVFTEHRGVLRALAEACYVNPEVAHQRDRIRSAYLRRVRDHLARQQRQGHCRPIDPEAAAVALGLMVEGAAQAWVVAGLQPFEKPLELERLCAQITDIWCRAVYKDPDLPLS